MLDIELNEITKTVLTQYFNIKEKNINEVPQSLIDTMLLMSIHFFIGDDDATYALNYIKDFKNNIEIDKNAPNTMYCGVDQDLQNELQQIQKSIKLKCNIELSIDDLANDLIIYHLGSLIDLIL